MSSTVQRAAWIGATTVAAAVIAGCGLTRVVQPSPDRLLQWSPVPLPPDPALMAAAAQGRSACTTGEDGVPVQILLQDRRTPLTAAFLFTAPNAFGSCLVTAGGGMSSGGSGPALEPMGGMLSVDDNGSGGVGEMSVRELGGRVAPNASQVRVVLTDGREIIASLGNGYWLAWWPDRARADHVVAVDATGAEIASTEVIE